MSNTMIVANFETLELQGYISAANANKIQDQLASAVASKENSSLLIDMHKVDFLDSAGLMALVVAFRLAQDMGKRFSICSVPPSVRIIFELTQLDDVFEIFETPASFQATLN